MMDCRVKPGNEEKAIPERVLIPIASAAR